MRTALLSRRASVVAIVKMNWLLGPSARILSNQRHSPLMAQMNGKLAQN
jgi:hypothetical protein